MNICKECDMKHELCDENKKKSSEIAITFFQIINRSKRHFTKQDT